MTKNMDINTDTQINIATSSEPRKVDDGRDDAKLSFLHTVKLKVETSLKGDLWLYNELMSLKKKMGIMQRDFDSKWTKITQLEFKISSIPDKLKEYK